jgi:hypothetical protein
MQLAIFLASIFEHDFLQLLHDTTQALQASIQALYFSFTKVVVIFTDAFFVDSFVVAAIVTKQIAAINTINFFISFFFKVYN